VAILFHTHEVGANKMTNAKYIRVTGCHDCDYQLIYHAYWHCNSDKCVEPINITSNYINHTIHPDCPLQDLESLIQPIIDECSDEVIKHLKEIYEREWERRHDGNMKNDR